MSSLPGARLVGDVVVLKFGGAALANPGRIRLAALRLEHWRRAGARPVAVVSACGGATDRILRWISAVTRDVPRGDRESDRALATGEDLAASLVAAALGARGIPATGLRGGEAGLVATGHHGRGRITRVDDGPLRALLDQGRVPVVSGFQAFTRSGDTVTLGRGASDLTAVRVAATLGAPECHLVKDVPGIHDRDPRAHHDAELLRDLSPSRLLRLTRNGAAVVQREAAVAAASLGVTLRIYGFRDPVFGRHGTTVSGGGQRRGVAPARPGSRRELERRGDSGPGKGKGLRLSSRTAGPPDPSRTLR